MIGLAAFRRRHEAARFHLAQHPRGGDAALGGIEHEHAADIARAGELVVPRAHDQNRSA
jgi:hypothetical protein